MEETGIPKKNIFIAVVLILGVYIAWFTLMPKPASQPPDRQKAVSETSVPSNIEKPKTKEASSLQIQKTQQMAEEKEFQALSIRGKVRLGYAGAISEINFFDSIKNEWMPLLVAGSSFLETPAEQPWRLTHTDANSIILEAPLSQSANLIKEIRFSDAPPGTGVMRLQIIQKQFDQEVSYPLTINIQGVLTTIKNDVPQQFVGYQGKKGLVIQEPKKKQTTIEPELMPGKKLAALGLASRYNLAVLYQLDTLKPGAAQHIPETQTWSYALSLEPNKEIDIPFYVGLKSHAVIESLGLKNLTYGGLLGPLKRFINLALSYLYKLTGNYGFAIILLTIVFQIIILPLTIKNFKISQKMKELAPKIKILQEKYKNDPKAMNAETMNLYRSQGTNPLGGCLILLVQMPIFIALYNTLNESYELYGAKFIFWIKNLADHDPTYVLPLLMGAAMLLQTKLTSTVTIDPSQKMLTYIMPAMFTFMFLKFPSGLVLYWLTSNVLNILVMAMLPKILDKGA